MKKKNFKAVIDFLAKQKMPISEDDAYSAFIEHKKNLKLRRDQNEITKMLMNDRDDYSYDVLVEYETKSNSCEVVASKGNDATWFTLFIKDSKKMRRAKMEAITDLIEGLIDFKKFKEIVKDIKENEGSL